jgi:hypothetical protein
MPCAMPHVMLYKSISHISFHCMVYGCMVVYFSFDLLSPTAVDRLSHMFTDAFDKDMQLMRADPRRSRYLACGLFVRGDVQVSDIHHHLGRIRSELDMIYWNEDGFKVGLCSVPPIGQVCTSIHRHALPLVMGNVSNGRSTHSHHAIDGMEHSRIRCWHWQTTVVLGIHVCRCCKDLTSSTSEK